MIHRHQLLFALSLCCLSLAVVGCPTMATDGPEVDAGDGDGDDNDAIVCESRDDCPDAVNWECQGVCLQLCASNEVCPADQFCDEGFCRRGCRAGTCEEDQICIEGSCQDRDDATTCGSKCDCETGEVCADGVCQPPPEECNSSAECGRGPEDNCEAFACNGFTKQCFYPDAPPCEEDVDCDFRPGCEEGCSCTPSGLCVSNADCTVETEADDCGAGAYCTADLACDALPTCSDDTDCEDLDMICDPLTGTCARPNPCVDDSDCTEAPATYCDLNDDPARCVLPTCMNGGIQCEANETCNPGTGACDPEVVDGDACQNNAQCSNDPWPDTEYCNVPFGEEEGTCTPGCQNNLSCPSGEVCNGAHECVVDDGGNTGSDGSEGSACDSIEDCQVGLVCHLLEGTCRETCGASDSPCDPATDSSCCALTGGTQCSPGFIFSFCSQ